MHWLLPAVIAGFNLAGLFHFSGVLSEKYGHAGEDGEKKVPWEKFVMTSALLSLPFLFFVKWNASPAIVAVGIAGGFFYGISSVPFFLSYKHIDALMISIFGQMMPICTTIAGAAAFGEKVGLAQISALTLVLSGCTIAAVAEKKENGKSEKEKRNPWLGFFFLMLSIAASVNYALAAKYLNIKGIGGLDVVVFGRAGTCLSGLFIFAFCARKMLKLFETRRALKHFCGNEVFAMLFSGFNLFAIAIQPDGASTGMVSTTYFGVAQVILFAYARSKHIERRLGLKALGAVVAFAGLLVLGFFGR